MEDSLCSWLAALIDGEGSIMLSKRTFSGNTERTTARGNPNTARYRPVVVVAANTDYRLMDAIRQRIVVGQIYEHVVSNTAQSHNPRKRRQWTYRLNVGQITTLLPEIQPWLVLKNEQATLLLEAMALKVRMTPGKGTEWYRGDQREPLVLRLDQIYAEIRALNTRGRTPEVSNE